jgi:hypothetical protein
MLRKSHLSLTISEHSDFRLLSKHQKTESEIVTMKCTYCSRKDRSMWDVLVMFGVASVLCSIAVVLLKLKQNRVQGPSKVAKSNSTTYIFNETSSTLPSQNVHLLFIGNSMLIKNDCPGLVQTLLDQSAVGGVTTKKCLRGGATLTSIWSNDRSCIENEFSNTVDFVIMNDQSQSPARQSSRSASIQTIQAQYAPLFNSNGRGASRPPVPVIIQTPAYHEVGIQGSSDLGDFDQFTNAMAEGVLQYRKAFNKLLNKGARIAPVGEAFRAIRNSDPTMFNKLYASDGFHLSPHGTWLQACIIYITCFLEKPTTNYNARWISPSNGNVPNADDAERLLGVACAVTGSC